MKPIPKLGNDKTTSKEIGPIFSCTATHCLVNPIRMGRSKNSNKFFQQRKRKRITNKERTINKILQTQMTLIAGDQ